MKKTFAIIAVVLCFCMLVSTAAFAENVVKIGVF